MAKVLRQRLYGLLFFIVVAALVAAAILQFNGTFTRYTYVTLSTDNAGHSLAANADVKARGVIVGQVQEITAGPDGEVFVQLGIDPEQAASLPAGTTARILPKTLFGERYVDLQPPERVSETFLADGDEIYTDVSGNARELQELFDRLLPVLEAIPPKDLSITLTALASALDGRGEQIGVTLERLEEIFAGVNGVLPDLEGTLEGLADFSTTYSEALPDVVDALDTLRTTTNTVVERQDDLRAFLSQVSAAAVDTTELLRTNRDDLIDLAIESEPFLTALAKQSPVFQCTFRNFATLMPESERIAGVGTDNPGVRVNLQFINPRGRYLPNQDEPRFFWTDPPARCYEPASDGRPFPQYPGGSLPDGSYQPPSRNAGPRDYPNLPQPQFSPAPAGYGSVEAREQRRLVYGAAAGVDPEQVPAWVTLIGAPGLAGSEVTIR